jgi:Tol biopolymer transport system component
MHDSEKRRSGHPRERNGRSSRGVAAVFAVVALVSLAAAACSSGSEARPPRNDEPQADEPGSKDIFADVHGWIAYGDESGIWAVDPSNPGDADDRVLLSARAGEPVAWSSDGSMLLIRRGSDRAPLYWLPADLIVLNADGTETHLTHGDGITDGITGGSFTPNGSKVIYAATHWEAEREWRSGIYVVNAEGGPPQLLLAAGRREAPDSFRMAVFHPTLSPDGSRIAYFEGMGDWGNSLWVMNADGSDKHQIVGREEEMQYSHVYNLQWSPDGTRLAFDFRGKPGGTNVVNADGSELSLAIAHGWNPHWSSDGSRISYVVTHGYGASGAALQVAAPDGGHVQDLGAGGSGPWNPLDPQT